MPTIIPTLDAIREAATRIAAAAGCRLVVVFGSVARAEKTPSDIDIGALPQGTLDVADCSARSSAVLGYGNLDVVNLARANPVPLMAVAREGVPVYEATASEFSVFSSLAMRRYADTSKFRDAVRDDIREYVRASDTAGNSR